MLPVTVRTTKKKRKRNKKQKRKNRKSKARLEREKQWKKMKFTSELKQQQNPSSTLQSLIEEPHNHLDNINQEELDDLQLNTNSNSNCMEILCEPNIKISNISDEYQDVKNDSTSNSIINTSLQPPHSQCSSECNNNDIIYARSTNGNDYMEQQHDEEVTKDKESLAHSLDTIDDVVHPDFVTTDFSTPSINNHNHLNITTDTNNASIPSSKPYHQCQQIVPTHPLMKMKELYCFKELPWNSLSPSTTLTDLVNISQQIISQSMLLVGVEPQINIEINDDNPFNNVKHQIMITGSTALSCIFVCILFISFLSGNFAEIFINTSISNEEENVETCQYSSQIPEEADYDETSSEDESDHAITEKSVSNLEQSQFVDIDHTTIDIEEGEIVEINPQQITENGVDKSGDKDTGRVSTTRDRSSHKEINRLSTTRDRDSPTDAETNRSSTARDRDKSSDTEITRSSTTRDKHSSRPRNRSRHHSRDKYKHSSSPRNRDRSRPRHRDRDKQKYGARDKHSSRPRHRDSDRDHRTRDRDRHRSRPKHRDRDRDHRTRDRDRHRSRPRHRDRDRDQIIRDERGCKQKCDKRKRSESPLVNKNQPTAKRQKLNNNNSPIINNIILSTKDDDMIECMDDEICHRNYNHNSLHDISITSINVNQPQQQENQPQSNHNTHRRPREMKPEIMEFLIEHQAGDNNLLYALLRGEFNKPNYGSFPQRAMGQNPATNKYDIISNLFIQQNSLEQIFGDEPDDAQNTKLDLIMRGSAIKKWVGKYIGASSTAGCIKGQILFSKSRKFTSDELQDDKWKQRHKLDDKWFNNKDNSKKEHGWFVHNSIKYPIPIRYRVSTTNEKFSQFHNIKPSDLWVNTNDVFISDIATPESRMTSLPSELIQFIKQQQQQRNVWNKPPPRLDHVQFNDHILFKAPCEYTKTLRLLYCAILHQQELNYELIDKLIFMWRKLIYKIKHPNDKDYFADFYKLSCITFKLLPLIPRHKYSWKHPLKHNASWNMGCSKRRSLASIFSKFIGISATNIHNKNNNNKPTLPPISEIFLQHQYATIHHQIIQRFKHEIIVKLTIPEIFASKDSYIVPEKAYPRKKCFNCWKSFNFHALHSAIRCSHCASARNDSCTACIAACGVNRNVPICTDCGSNKFLIRHIKNTEIKKLRNVRLAQTLITSNEILIQFTPRRTKFAFFAKGVLVNDRFAKFDRDEFIQAFGKHRFHLLLLKYVNKKLNVTFTEYNLNLYEAKKQYYQERGDELHTEDNCNWLFKNETFKVKVSAIGPLEWNGHVIAPKVIHDIISDRNNLEDDVIHGIDDIFPNGQKLEDNKIAQLYCHSVLLNPGHAAILQQHKGYKNRYNCHFQLTHSIDRMNKILKKQNTNLIHQYWNPKELEHLQSNMKEDLLNFTGNTKEKAQKHKNFTRDILAREPKLEVVDTKNVTEYLKQNHNKLHEAMSHYEILSNILSFAIATQIPQLKPTFWQYLERDSSFEVRQPHGSHYQNKDYIKYWQGHKVMAHVDHADLHQKGNNFGPYIIFKLGKDGADQMLCSVSNKANGCEYDRSKVPGDREYGGHVKLPPGSIYWMFDEGAFGGISHSIHNAECKNTMWSPELFGGFQSTSHTLVMRPNF